jgi:hypothetical protein
VRVRVRVVVVVVVVVVLRLDARDDLDPPVLHAAHGQDAIRDALEQV